MPSECFEAIGTRWKIESETPIFKHLLAAVNERIGVFDATYSRFRTDSLVNQIAQRPGSYRFPDDATSLFEVYRALYLATDGAFTPLVGHALEHLGYDSDYTLRRRPGTVGVPQWEAVLHTDGPLITTTEPILLDVGAAGKGYLVDLVAELLIDSGATSFVVDGSGDLLHRGPDPYRVGLENPLNTSEVIGVVELSNTAIGASAVNRRRWGDGLHHIIDPATGEPTHGVLATWAVADSCVVADALATALFLTEPARLAEHFDFSYVRMFDSGAVEFSANFPGELFR